MEHFYKPYFNDPLRPFDALKRDDLMFLLSMLPDLDSS